MNTFENQDAVVQSTSRELYATLFAVHFAREFAELELSGEDSFIITTEQFDKFLLGYMLTFTDDIEIEPRNPLWAKFVQERNTIRAEMNRASAIGAHGNPAYRVDAIRGHRGEYTVRLMSSMLLTTATTMAENLKDLFNNKDSDLGLMTKYILENADTLPESQQIQGRMLQMSFRNAAKVAALALNNVAEEASVLFKELGMDVPKAAQIEHTPENEPV